jgi:pyridoxamine 5'-phosphate oxidase
VSFEDVPRDASLAPPLPSSPLGLLARWLDEARQRSGMRNPMAMNVASVGADGRPSARLVLCRGFDRNEGFVVFYTNYDSRKARELEAAPQAAATFYWDGMSRQVRIEGPVVRSPAEDSDAYFAGRPRPSQISAWASAQSEPLESREQLLEQLAATERRFAPEGGPVPRPPYWGGYRIHAERIELWVGAEGRAHDRGCWTRSLRPAAAAGVFEAGEWRAQRLQP